MTGHGKVRLDVVYAREARVTHTAALAGAALRHLFLSLDNDVKPSLDVVGCILGLQLGLVGDVVLVSVLAAVTLPVGNTFLLGLVFGLGRVQLDTMLHRCTRHTLSLDIAMLAHVAAAVLLLIVEVEILDGQLTPALRTYFRFHNIN